MQIIRDILSWKLFTTIATTKTERDVKNVVDID